MRLGTILALLATLVFGFATQTMAGSPQSGAAVDALCAVSAPAKPQTACASAAGVTKVSWQDRLGRIVGGQDTVVYDRCPPGSDKFCPAGAYCCQNSAGQYRCCK